MCLPDREALEAYLRSMPLPAPKPPSLWRDIWDAAMDGVTVLAFAATVGVGIAALVL